MKRVLITGVSSDIGLALATKYQKEGWYVVGHFRNERPELDNIRKGDFEGWRCDFTDSQNLNDEIQTNKDKFSNISAFVNLASDLKPKSFYDLNPIDFISALKINLLPGLLIMQQISKSMIKNNFGRIVQGSSIGVKFGGGLNSVTYSLSKHAQEFIPKECREWAASNVFVNIARIGVTHTRLHSKINGKDLEKRKDMIPAGRLATTQDIAKALFWLGSEENTFTSGAIIPISGGE
jgi:3-oxoacyl-[acyl-carrier protein] reductase